MSDNTALIYRTFGAPESVLSLQSVEAEELAADRVRVAMALSPVNASDLIPITGAYRHRITLPAIAGYEGVGTVIQAPPQAAHLLGKRVLPLRGQGTWQRLVDCPAAFTVPVPDDISDTLAARAYINPLAALLMLNLYPPAGKHVLITAAGSDCAALLGQWALKRGALSVTGVHRSPVHQQKLAECGIRPLEETRVAEIETLAQTTDIVYDATGGKLADLLLSSMRKTALFVSYGLLSGQPYRVLPHHPPTQWFHIRNVLDAVSAAQWQALFAELWPLLRQSQLNDASLFPLAHWQEAIALYKTPGRTRKPLLAFSVKA
ncbi:zinc-dependent alcohol dehydrogenase family protein [Phytobacter diazotrophicus]|uniref:zinc-dependent alcohol dehydrogenase family protein n=1 Tax=Phytobacter diazotrophicus TaxID=395631 RepID=UPI0014527F3D|nr:zinc-dependent alcohol dehydrogenase family protein [Phytobacter diazotrophicus]QJF17874.1 zinc-dependent alcohol dehydrogenase family protein [Phytobacter diazotrophicus]